METIQQIPENFTEWTTDELNVRLGVIAVHQVALAHGAERSADMDRETAHITFELACRSVEAEDAA